MVNDLKNFLLKSLLIISSFWTQEVHTMIMIMIKEILKSKIWQTLPINLMKKKSHSKTNKASSPYATKLRYSSPVTK